MKLFLKLCISIITLAFFIACENPFLRLYPKDETKELDDPQVPSFIIQPGNMIYFIDDTNVQDLVAEASVNDSGVLTYKWFCYSEGSSTINEISALEISYEGRKAFYTPPVNEIGVIYYYTVATNTLNSKTKTRESNHAKITVVNSTFDGTAEITGTYRIGQTLSVDTSGIIDASAPFIYQWKADDADISGERDISYVIRGDDAGKLITCEITHATIGGEVTATGEIVPFDITITFSGNTGTDNVTADPDFGLNEAIVTLNYTLAGGYANNRLAFSGTASAIEQVSAVGSGTRQYTIAAADATNGVITINASFTHTNLEIDEIAFADTSNVTKTYGDAGFTKAITNTGAGSGTISYNSSNTAVATVNNTGNVTVLLPGTTTITATKASDGTHEQATASYQLTVNPKGLTITGLGAANKEYDGKTNAVVTGTASLTGIVEGDIVTVTSGTASFNNKIAENDKTVTFSGYSIGGADASKYTLSGQPANVTANITQLQLTIAAPSLTTSKIYNGTTTAAVTAGALTNAIQGDSISAFATGNYDTADAGTGKTITVIYTLTGIDADNYIKPVDLTVTTGIITIAEGSTIATVPIMKERTDTSITVNAATLTTATGQNIEYGRSSSSSTQPSTWQPELLFSGLTANTTYYIWARSAANNNYNAGTPRTSLAITTLAAQGDIPRFVKIDFENEPLNKDFQFTRGDNDPSLVRVVADPAPPAGSDSTKSLQLTTSSGSAWNQAAIIPITLPNKLQDYQNISLRFRHANGTSSDVNSKHIQVFASDNSNTFIRYGFGNNSTAANHFANNRIGTSQAVNFSDTNQWVDFSGANVITINTNTTTQNLQGSIFLAIGINNGTTLNYYLDDIIFTLQDGVDPVPPPDPPLEPPITPPVPAAQGAVSTGIYRNLFAEYGYPQNEINAKIEYAYNRLFSTTDANRIYYLDPTDSSKAYILDTGNDDVRSEGMSYGMMMAVQMDDKDIFDRLWRWARHYMYNDNPEGRNMRGYFTWAMYTNGTVKDLGIAPDGEFYFATALLFASARWGDGEGVLNYGWHARQLLFDMCRRNNPEGGSWDAPGLFRRPGDHRTNNTVASPMAIGNHMPVFSPYGNAGTYSDPSYHLPSFYEIWALELENDWAATTAAEGVFPYTGIWSDPNDLKADADFYKEAAATSRRFFQSMIRAESGNTTTFLGPDYANFDGSPQRGESGTDHRTFRYDAWRIAMNIGMDYAWWAADPWQVTFSNGIQSFFHSKGINSYGSLWNLDGTLTIGGNGQPEGPDHSPGLVACNAVATFAATQQISWEFIQDFWNAGMTGGQWRYYDGCLYMMGLLHVTGNFKAYMRSNTTITPSAVFDPNTATFDKNQQQDITVNVTLNDNTLGTIQNGAAVLTNGTHYTVSGSGDSRTVTISSSYLAALSAGTTATLTFNFTPGQNRALSIDIIDTTPSSSISPETSTFNKDSPSNIGVTLTLNGNTLSSITNGEYTLSSSGPTPDYTVSGSNVTINSSYLETLVNGSRTLVFNFSAGMPQTLTVTVSGGAISTTTSYNFATTDPGEVWEFNSNKHANTTAALVSGTGLQYTFGEGAGTNDVLVLTFNLGGETLADYSSIYIRMRSTTTSYKNARFEVSSTGNFVKSGQNIGNTIISNSTRTVNGTNEWGEEVFTLQGDRSSYTGTVKIAIAIAEYSGADTYQISQIELRK